MRLLLAKKWGSPRRFHSRAELKCSRSARLEKWLDHGCLATIFSVLFGLKTLRACSSGISVALVRFSTIQSIHLSLFLPVSQLSPPEMTKITKWFTPLVRLPLCFKFMYSKGEKKLTTFAKQSFYKVSTEFSIYNISLYIHLIFNFLVFLCLTCIPKMV